MNVSLTGAAPIGFAAFRQAYDAGRGSLVWRKTVADLETPVAAFLKLAHGQPNSFLLESVEGGAARGRYSVIGMQPDLIWRGLGQPACAVGAACVRCGGEGASGQSAGADRGDPAGGAGAPAADGRRA